MNEYTNNCKQSEPPSYANGAPGLYIYLFIYLFIYIYIYDRSFWLPGGPTLRANVAGRIVLESV